MTNNSEERPEGDLIEIDDLNQRRRWARWFDVSEEMLVRVVGLVGPFARHVADILGKRKHPPQ